MYSFVAFVIDGVLQWASGRRDAAIVPLGTRKVATMVASRTGAVRVTRKELDTFGRLHPAQRRQRAGVSVARGNAT
jgi:hypothetical protein